MLKKLSLPAALFICMFGAAQKPAYHSYNFMGVLAGEGDGYQLLTTHGIEKGTYFLGLGAGIDNYNHKWSFPLFVTASKYLFPSRNNLFINLNTGLSIVPNSEKGTLPGSLSSVFKPRPFAEAGLAYRLHVEPDKKGQGILFGAYYSYKAIREKFTLVGSCPNPPCTDKYEYIDYRQHRWALKMGFAL